MARACFLIFGGEHRGAHHDPTDADHPHSDPDVKHAAVSDEVDHVTQGREAPAVHAAMDPGSGIGSLASDEARAAAADDVHATHAAHGAGGGHGDDHHGGHAEPHESGLQMVVPLVILAVLSLTVGFIGSPAWTGERNFETWTATHVLEETTYPFLEDGHGGGYEGDEDHAAALTGGGVLAAGPVLAAAEDHGPEVLHGPPSWHLDVLLMALIAFLAAVALAWRFYGKGQPDDDPVFKMGPLSRALVAKYGLDDAGYRWVVVPVRDKLSGAASWSSNVVLDGIVAGTGRATMRAATTTYRVLDQRVIDGGVNGAAFSAAWWSDRLRRLQSGDVQRYAGALVAGVIVLVLAFAAAT